MSLVRDTACSCDEHLLEDAKLLISHFRDEDLLCWDAGQRIFDALAKAHKHNSEFEDQDDFDNAFCKLHREHNQTLLQVANVAGLPI